MYYVLIPPFSKCYQVKELEEKLREKEQEHVIPTFSAEMLGAIPKERKTWSRRETIGEIDPLRRRSLSYNNQMTNQESVLLKGTDSLRDLRRRRELQTKGHEKFILPATSVDRKIFSAESRSEISGEHRALARITRSTKPPAATNAQKAGPNNKRYRDQFPAVKSRTWL